MLNSDWKCNLSVSKQPKMILTTKTQDCQVQFE